jgi:hypothetical protein
MDNNYLQSPHIGDLLKKFTTDRRTYKSAWARHQKVYHSTVMRYFKKQSMQVSTLFTISQVLKFNFIRQVADALPAEYPPFGSNPLQLENEAMKKEIEDLKKENALLKELLLRKN